MNVTAKFKTVSKKESEEDGAEIRAEAVTDGSPENEEFFKYTPGGELALFVVNSSASAFFEPGEEFFLTFSRTREA